MSKPVMNREESLNAVEKQLSQLSIRDEVQVGVLGSLKTDLILPWLFDSLEKGECFYAEVKSDKDRISVNIGPRDWSFSDKGELLGSGTML